MRDALQALCELAELKVLQGYNILVLSDRNMNRDFIAIPALVAYMYLAGRIDSLVLEMDRLGQELVHLISADALRDRAMLASEPAPAPSKAG